MRLAACLAACLAGVLAARADAAPPSVLVFPRSPETSAAAGEQAVRAAGLGAVPFAPVAERLRAGEAHERARLDAVLAGVERRLAAAGQAFLEQRYDAMLADLGALEAESLDVLAHPEHCSTLWEVEFQLGLARATRRAAGDEKESRQRYLFALSLDPERRPVKELYGPDVLQSFAVALAERSRTALHPARVKVEPPDATVAVDCVPLLEPGQGRLLGPGLHVLRAAAPGYRSRAVVFSGAGVVVALDRDGAEDPAEPLGASWAAGALRADAPATLAAVRAVGRASGARAVLLLDAPGGGPATARLLTQADATAPVVRPTAAAAAAAALERLAPDGTLRAEAPRPALPAPPRRPSVLGRWWFWTAVGAVAAAGVAIVVMTLPEEPDRVRIVAP